MSDLVAAVRSAQIERGCTEKILGKEVKSLGRVSLGLLLADLGKVLVMVDDPEQIRLVEGRWTKRRIIGGAVRQMRARRSAP